MAAIVLGVTAGSLNAPTGAAAREPAALGFVPEPGWFALQSPPPVVPGQQTVAVAANVPFARDDTIHGLVEPSGLPYSTLLGLPPKGIVVVASMTSDAPPHLAPVLANPMYPEAKLPLRLRDGASNLQLGAQVRPDQPLAQRQLRARIGHYDVDVVAYFGVSYPTEAQLDAAQRQLDGLVIRPASRPQRAAPCHPQPLLRSPSSTTPTRATRRCSVACTSSRIVRMRAFVRDPDGRSSRMWSPEVGDGPPR